jgi:hypothetical protein
MEKWDWFPKTSVPIGMSFFPKEIIQRPRACVSIVPFYSICWADEGCIIEASSLLRAQGKIVFESDHEVGGHFASYEQPELLVSDLRKMFGKSGPAAGVVPGCTGY